MAPRCQGDIGIGSPAQLSPAPPCQPPWAAPRCKGKPRGLVKAYGETTPWREATSSCPPCSRGSTSSVRWWSVQMGHPGVLGRAGGAGSSRRGGPLPKVVGKAAVQPQGAGPPAPPHTRPAEGTGRPRSPRFLLCAVPERTL